MTKDRFLAGRPTPRAAPLPTPPTVSSTTEKLISSIVNRERQGETSQPLTLFDRIKSRINKAKQQNEQQTPPTQKPQPKQKPKFRTPQQPPPQTFEQSQTSSTFGVFEQVNLDNFGRQREPVSSGKPQLPRIGTSQQQQSNGFFGVFPEVKL